MMRSYDADRAAIDSRLSALLTPGDVLHTAVSDAMAYAALGGGKRVRGVLTLAFCRACRGDAASALDAACAVEMVHAYSLIHDDLPCMDNDDLRRGKPACHVAFGESTALLAGDGLLTYAFEVLLTSGPSDAGLLRAARAARVLAASAGAWGMIGGQALDLSFEGEAPGEAALIQMYEKKTGALFRAACEIGCIMGGDEALIGRARMYADRIGLAFQIIDDILDVAGDEGLLGKPTGSDIASGKTTYVSLRGIEAAQLAVHRLTEEAKAALFDIDADDLVAFADALQDRNF